MGEAHKGYKSCFGGIPMINNEAQQEQLISCKCTFCGAFMDRKVDHLWKHILGICKKVDFNSRTKIMQMEWKGGTTTAMETSPVEAVNSPLMASGISTAASASMSSCALKKRGMDK